VGTVGRNVLRAVVRELQLIVAGSTGGDRCAGCHKQLLLFGNRC
jgi:hypothetical protein